MASGHREGGGLAGISCFLTWSVNAAPRYEVKEKGVFWPFRAPISGKVPSVGRCYFTLH